MDTEMARPLSRTGSPAGVCLVFCLLSVALAWPFVLFAAAPHVPVALMDRSGRSVAESGAPVSAAVTCGGCHVAQLLSAHCFHVETEGTIRPQSGVGLGPFDGDPERHIVDPVSGQPITWDWRTPAAAETNCFLCHLADPDNRARIAQIEAGRSDLALTATLGKSGSVTRSPRGWVYSATTRMVAPLGRAPAAVSAAWVDVCVPTAKHCGQCHGRVHSGDEPLTLDLTLTDRSTINTGQVFAPSRMFESAVNLKDKRRLTRSWDVHAEKKVDCVGCHYPLGAPDSLFVDSATAPDHLIHDPRLPRGARGDPSRWASPDSSRAPKPALRCVDCHDPTVAHDWLPSRKSHFAALSCEACHIPTASGPAMQSIDWTLPDLDGRPIVQWRGIEGAPNDPDALVTGFSPTLLLRKDAKGRTQLVPHNLVTALYWVQGGSRPGPIPLVDLRAALLENGRWAHELLDVLDADGDRQIADAERVLDSADKVDAVRRRLLAAGIKEPRVEIDIHPHALRHGVAPTDEATRRCQTCHAADSRLSQPFPMAGVAWEGFSNFSSNDTRVAFEGTIEPDDLGRLVYEPNTLWAGLYVPGQSGPHWVDILGGLGLLGVALGVVAHAGMRFLANLRRTDSTPAEGES